MQAGNSRESSQGPGSWLDYFYMGACGMDKENLRKSDLLASLVLLVVSIFALVNSIKMTFFVEIPGVDADGWFVAPGVFPLGLSLGLTIMALFVLSVAVKEGGMIHLNEWKKALDTIISHDSLVTLAEIGLLFLYAFVLLGRVHFAIATAIYLFFAMLIVKAARWYTIGIISGTVAVVISYLFGNLFKIPLP